MSAILEIKSLRKQGYGRLWSFDVAFRGAAAMESWRKHASKRGKEIVAERQPLQPLKIKIIKKEAKFGILKLSYPLSTVPHHASIRVQMNTLVLFKKGDSGLQQPCPLLLLHYYLKAIFGWTKRESSTQQSRTDSMANFIFCTVFL